MTVPPQLANAPSAGLYARDAEYLAHDLNGLAQVAMLKLELLKARSETDSATLKAFHDLEKVLHDMSLVIRSALTTFQPDQLATVDPGEVIASTVDLVRALGRAAITIDVPNPPRDVRVPILQSHLQQVVFNLTKCAVESLPETGGQVVVTASLKERGHLIPGAGWDSRQALCITVEDNAPSPAHSLSRRLFRNPFATKGNAQGESITHCQKLLALYGGTLTYEDLGGAGTRARIFWPF